MNSYIGAHESYSWSVHLVKWVWTNLLFYLAAIIISGAAFLAVTSAYYFVSTSQIPKPSIEKSTPPFVLPGSKGDILPILPNDVPIANLKPKQMVGQPVNGPHGLLLGYIAKVVTDDKGKIASVYIVPSPSLGPTALASSDFPLNPPQAINVQVNALSITQPDLGGVRLIVTEEALKNGPYRREFFYR